MSRKSKTLLAIGVLSIVWFVLSVLVTWLMLFRLSNDLSCSFFSSVPCDSPLWIFQAVFTVAIYFLVPPVAIASLIGLIVALKEPRSNKAGVILCAFGVALNGISVLIVIIMNM